jgi:predicted RND superfamily exporter protein
LGYGFEIAYAMAQASSKKDLKKKVEDTIENFPKDSPITMRTCIENASDPRVLREMNHLSERNENVIYALEPNSKLVNTLSEYIEYVNNIKENNPELEIGLDLDLTHLKEERNLQEILERLEGTKDFPLMISLGGTVLSEQDIKLDTHLPLNLQDDNVVKNLGEYYSVLRFRNERMPSLVFETNPAEEGLFDNYKEFLRSFNKGIH